MSQSKQCPKCAGSMSEGFVMDATHGGVSVSSWIEGAPVKSAWTGLRIGGRARSEIASWRCNRCGFLEHYATAQPDRSHEAVQRSRVLLVVASLLAVLLVILGAVLLLRH